MLIYNTCLVHSTPCNYFFILREVKWTLRTGHTVLHLALTVQYGQTHSSKAMEILSVVMIRHPQATV